LAHALPLIAASASHATAGASPPPSPSAPPPPVPASVAASFEPEEEQPTHIAMNALNAIGSPHLNVTGAYYCQCASATTEAHLPEGGRGGGEAHQVGRRATGRASRSRCCRGRVSHGESPLKLCASCGRLRRKPPPRPQTPPASELGADAGEQDERRARPDVQERGEAEQRLELLAAAHVLDSRLRVAERMAGPGSSSRDIPPERVAGQPR
jgi:hypothetical protein